MKTTKRLLIALCLLLASLSTRADQLPYTCDFGLQGGPCYYVGDAQSHIFQNVQWTVGLQFRYKFDPRWSLQVKGQYDNIAFPYNGAKQKSAMLNFDANAEFNFFRFGIADYDDRVKPITPYIFLGLGFSCYDLINSKFTGYFPFGIGLKYKPHPRTTLILAWQHQLYFSDKIERIAELNNPAGMNGTNFLLNDLSGTLTAGVVVEFLQQRKVCSACNL